MIADTRLLISVATAFYQTFYHKLSIFSEDAKTVFLIIIIRRRMRGQRIMES